MVGIAHCRVNDSDELAGALRAWEQSYTQIGKGRLDAEVMQVSLGQATLISERSNLQLQECMVPPQGQIVVGVPLKLGAPAVFNGHPLRHNSLLVVEGGKELEISTSGEIHMLGFCIDAQRLKRYLSDVDYTRFATALRKASIQSSEQEVEVVRQLIVGAIARSNEDAGDQGNVVAELIDSILDTLQATEPAKGLAPKTIEDHRQLVSRATELMRADLSNPKSIVEICEVLGVSQRTLQYCFKHICQTTPQQYFLSLRLSEAKRLLRSKALSVTEVAYELGFSSSSHFSNVFKQAFAGNPSLFQG